MSISSVLAQNELVKQSEEKYRGVIENLKLGISEVDNDDKIKPKIIIRTSIGSQKPLHPQYQHIGDFSVAIKKMCSTIDVIKLNDPNKIFSSYKKAYERKDGKNTILVEYGDYYSEK